MKRQKIEPKHADAVDPAVAAPSRDVHLMKPDSLRIFWHRRSNAPGFILSRQSSSKSCHGSSKAEA
jgi:hypothetical protein